MVATMRHVAGVGFLLVPVLLGVAPLRAQEPGTPDETETPGRLTFSGEIGVLAPTGEFAEYVDPGLALQGHLGILFRPDGWLGVRVQGGWADGGSREQDRRIVVEGIPIDVRVRTRMSVAHGGLGPQARFRVGPLGGHGYATVGFLALTTKTIAEIDAITGVGEEIRLSETDHQSTWKTDFAFGGGLRFSVVSLDVQYHLRGDTKYVPVVRVPEDDVTQSVEPVDGKANFLLITLGIWLGP